MTCYNNGHADAPCVPEFPRCRRAYRYPAGLCIRSPVPTTKKIPRTGHPLPVIGMGSWITFDVGNDAQARAARTQVLKTFFALGGGMIDSSPMYGSSEDVIGHGLTALGMPRGLFSATKVWTPGKDHGVRQMAESERLWGLKTFDLLQVHNLLGWEGHLETLKQWKADGRVRHIGITTSHGGAIGTSPASWRPNPSISCN